jgi:rod shape-determining protein MreC
MKLLVSNIIGRDFNGFNKIIILDRGQKDGVQKDDAIIMAGSILVGKIIEVYPNFSKAMLINDPNSIINSLVQDSRALGVVKGHTEKGVIFDLVLQQSDLISDQIIVTSGQDGLPKGLYLGKIGDILSSDSSVFQKATVKLSVDLSRLEKLFIVIR